MTKRKNNALNLSIIFTILVLVIACSCPNSRERVGDEDRPLADRTEDKKDTKGDVKEDKGDFIVEHGGVRNPRYEAVDRSIRESKTLEKAADKLNRSLILPADITLRSKDCNTPNAFYLSRDRSITICYELMEHFYRVFRGNGDSDARAKERMNRAITFIFLHELGHALIDQYDLPITANEEDAADRCSSYICIEELGDQGVQAVIAGAEFFAIQSKLTKKDRKTMADEHLLNEQRFFNALCMIYGSDPNKYRGIVQNGLLPKARAVRCPNEYSRMAKSWETLLEPWRKD